MIRLDDVSLVVEGRKILDGVSLEVAAGESVALVGPNGSGKTSLFRCLLGLAPFTGTITVDGRDLARDPVAVRRGIAYLPQKPAFGDVTAAEALRFIARLRRLPDLKVAAALARTGLSKDGDRRVTAFSGGMLQRLSLAAALLVEPRILLLDEPTASLDREGQELFASLVAGWRESGATLLVTSHRADELARFTDRPVRLSEGRVEGKILRMSVGVER